MVLQLPLNEIWQYRNRTYSSQCPALKYRWILDLEYVEGLEEDRRVKAKV